MLTVPQFDEVLALPNLGARIWDMQFTRDGKSLMTTDNEGQVVEFEEVANKCKTSAENLKVHR